MGVRTQVRIRLPACYHSRQQSKQQEHELLSKAPIHSECSGHETPRLLFVHGWCGDSTQWRYQREHFEPSHQVVTCDLRGHGASKEFEVGFDVPTGGADVARLLTDSEVSPTVVAGHGMGCRMVLEAVQLAPDAVVGVVLVNGNRNITGDPDQAVRDVRDRYAATGFDHLRETLLDAMFHQDSDSVHKAEIIERARRVPESVAEAYWCNILRWDAAHMEIALKSLKVPLLILQSTYLTSEYKYLGVEPRMVTPWFEVIGRLVPTVRIQIIGGVGHFPMLDAAEALNRCIATFLADATFRRFFESR